MAHNIFKFQKQFWYSLIMMNIIMFSRFSDGFIILRAKECGWEDAALPLILMFVYIINSLASYPFGNLSDKYGKKNIILLGFSFLFVGQASLFLAYNPVLLFLGIIMTGLEMSILYGVTKALISNHLPDDLKGTGFSILSLTTGITLFAGNFMAGWLCSCIGSGGAFLGGAITSTICFVWTLKFVRD